jgi:hypothetical protein
MDELSPLEQRQYDEVIEDLRLQPPALLIVETSVRKQAFGDSDFRFLRYFLRDPRFARLFRDYEFITQVGAHRVYERRR